MKSDADAEDIVAEAFLKAARSFSAFDTVTTLVPSSLAISCMVGFFILVDYILSCMPASHAAALPSLCRIGLHNPSPDRMYHPGSSGICAEQKYCIYRQFIYMNRIRMIDLPAMQI